MVRRAHRVPDPRQRGGIAMDRVLRRRRRLGPHLTQPGEEIQFVYVFHGQRPAGHGLGGGRRRTLAERRPKHLIGDVVAKRAIALELRFVEELVRGSLVRKGAVLGRVAQHIGGLVAGQRALDVEKGARHFLPVLAVVADAADGAVPLARRAARRGANLADVDLDVDAEVRPALLDGVPQIAERDGAVLAGVARDDEPAPAPDQLIDPQVLEVPAVGKIDPLAPIGGHSQQLVQQLAQRQAARRALPDLRPARIAQPPAQPHVEDRHQEGQRRRRVVAHVGGGGRPGGGDRHAHRQRPLVAGVLARGRVSVQPVVGEVFPLFVGAVLEAAVGRREDERRGLALLPGQVLSAHQVERHVVDRIGADGPRHLCGVGRERQVVVAVETSKGIRFPLPGGAKKAAHEPVAVQVVERELVQVYQPRHCQRHGARADAQAGQHGEIDPADFERYRPHRRGAGEAFAASLRVVRSSGRNPDARRRE